MSNSGPGIHLPTSEPDFDGLEKDFMAKRDRLIRAMRQHGFGLEEAEEMVHAVIDAAAKLTEAP